MDPDPSNFDFLTKGISEVGSGNSTFINNMITTPSGIGTRTSYNTEIINNTIHYFDPANYTSNWGGGGISADPDTVCTIFGNSITYYSLGLMISSDTVVIGNVLDHLSYGNMITGDSNVLLNNRFNSSQYWGIEFTGNNNTLRNNTFSNMSLFGMRILNSEGGFVIDGCSFENIGDSDIIMESSKNVTLTNNSMVNGIEIEGSDPEYWNTHNIDTLNSINGKPLRYYSGQNNFSLTGSAGQIIIANSSKINITGYIFSGQKLPLSIVFSDNISVDANEFANGTIGMYLKETHDINIKTNVFYNLDYGIKWNSSFQDIINNNLFKMNNRSIYVEGSSYLQVTNNSFESHVVDIEARFLDFSMIEGNDHYNSTEVLFRNIDMVVSIGNILTMNKGPAIRLVGGSLNMIYHNIDLKESFDYEEGNIWNLDYPYGGNHWASYPGKDFLKGPHQDIMGGDWIGDDPVYLNQWRTTKDEYPLMSPQGSITEGGSVFISNPDDGDVVSGNILIEATVVSSHFYWVNFYVNGELVLTDSEFPYQMIFYSNNYAEGSIVNITAELGFITIPNVTSTVYVTVDNVVEETDSLVVETNSAEYHPDQQLTVNVSFQGSYVIFNEMVLTAILDGPDPVMIHYNRFVFDASNSFMFILEIPSDIPIGDYVLKIKGSAYWGDINLWISTNSTTFQITGKDLHSELDEIDSFLEVMDNFEVSLLNDTINMIYQTLIDLQGDVDFINLSYSQAFIDIQGSLSLLEIQLLGRIDTLELNITRLLIDMNASLQQAIALSISGILGRLDDVDLSLDILNSGMSGMDSDLIAVRADILGAIGEHDDAMYENTTDLIDLIRLRFDQLELIVSIVNASIHYHLDEIEGAVNEFKVVTLYQFNGMLEYIEMMNSSTSNELLGIQGSIVETQTLLMELDSQSLETIGLMFQEIMDRIDDLDEEQAAHLRENMTRILLQFVDLNSNIDAHSADIRIAMGSLSKLDEIIEEVEHVDASVKESEDGLSEKDDRFQIFLIVIILFLIVIMALQAYMLTSMRRDNNEREGQDDISVGARRSPQPLTPPREAGGQRLKTPRKHSPRRSRAQVEEKVDDWDDLEELEEL
ncbi:MAG: right-handed parallel beta-helix repeat-containing protein [Thermoplasmata archaeon]|nr:right-handed parallel beta-helix repeat-containing protein [Thermoplasmata archaeon]